jgi:septum formation protein
MAGLILASASEIRARLLANAGVSFDIRPARVDENSVKASLLAEGADGRAIADALAELKAVRVSATVSETLVLGADQVLLFDGQLVNKCEDMAGAAFLLKAMRGKPHQLVSAAVLAKGGRAIWRRLDTVSLWMRPASDAFLEDYLAAEGPEILASVGCYRFESRGAQLFERIEGDYFSILGLPLLPLLAALRDQDVIAK